jgi:hypothetical protein
VSWYQERERERERIVRARRSQQLQYRVAGSAISVGDGVAGAAGRVLGGLGARGL